MRRGKVSKVVKMCLFCTVVCLLYGVTFFAGVRVGGGGCFLMERQEIQQDIQEDIQDSLDSQAKPETATHSSLLPTVIHRPFQANSAATRRDSGEVVWIYSLITTDYDGPKVIPHFIKHYSDMGIPSDRFFVDLLHDPALSDEGLKMAEELFRSFGASIRMIMHAYKPDLQDQAMLSGLEAMPMDIEDWVIVADMDELFTYGASNVHEAVKAMSAEGATYALGEMLDHVAPEGRLQHVVDTADIWSQFPLICPVVSKVAKGLPAKVTVHKAFLRTGAGHHHIVHPPLAKAYFSDECVGIPCELVMKRYKQRTLENLYKLTPYKQYASRYLSPANKSGWEARQWSAWTKVHHFKWHGSILENLRLRMVRDSGNCELDVNEDNCQPVFQFWKEVALTFHELNITRSINITSMGCKEGVDTLWNW